MGVITRGLVGKKRYSKLKRYEVSGWIHPLKGGDDREFELVVRGASKEIVRKRISNWLRKHSHLTNDFIVEEIN